MSSIFWGIALSVEHTNLAFFKIEGINEVKHNYVDEIEVESFRA